MADAIAPGELPERVQLTAPLIAQRAASAEAAHKPDDEVIDALKATGVFRAFVPARFGGFEIGLDSFVDIGIAVNEACAPTGWVTTFYMAHNWLLGLFPDAVQQEVFAAQPYIPAPGSVNPNSGRHSRAKVATASQVTGASRPASYMRIGCC